MTIEEFRALTNVHVTQDYYWHIVEPNYMKGFGECLMEDFCREWKKDNATFFVTCHIDDVRATEEKAIKGEAAARIIDAKDIEIMKLKANIYDFTKNQ